MTASMRTWEEISQFFIMLVNKHLKVECWSDSCIQQMKLSLWMTMTKICYEAYKFIDDFIPIQIAKYFIANEWTQW